MEIDYVGSVGAFFRKWQQAHMQALHSNAKISALLEWNAFQDQWISILATEFGIPESEIQFITKEWIKFDTRFNGVCWYFHLPYSENIPDELEGTVDWYNWRIISEWSEPQTNHKIVIFVVCLS